MKHISVIGCGTMGNGIAQTFALFDFKVKLYDLSLNNLDNAKIKIRAFNVLGPAFTYFNDKVLKIHSYTEEANSEGIIFNEGVLYPEYVTPEGKKQMLFPDYIRGIK